MKLKLIIFLLITISCSYIPKSICTETEKLNRQLTNAIANSDDNKINALLTAGADVNATDRYGYTILMLAARSCSVDIINLLLEMGANINARDQHSNTVLMFCAFNGKSDIVNALLKKNADTNSINSIGYTALMYAEKNKHTDIIKALTAAK